MEKNFQDIAEDLTTEEVIATFHLTKIDFIKEYGHKKWNELFESHLNKLIDMDRLYNEDTN